MCSSARSAPALLAVLAALIAGCGGAASGASIERQAVAVANAVCRDYQAYVAARTASVRVEGERDQEYRARLLTALQPAAHRPRVAAYLKARAVLEAQVDSIRAFPEKIYQARLAVYRAEKALSLSNCIDPPPRKPIEG
jgi:hypothetical protein